MKVSFSNALVRKSRSASLSSTMRRVNFRAFTKDVHGNEILPGRREWIVGFLDFWISGGYIRRSYSRACTYYWATNRVTCPTAPKSGLLDFWIDGWLDRWIAGQG